MKNNKNELKTIVLGGGCFWCTEAVFKMVEGIVEVIPGYAGGWKKDPSYEDVTTGQTGHAEVVKLTYDPDQVTLNKILQIFFKTHDPTTLNRQGADVGSQYRSIILYSDKKQLELIDNFIKQLEPEYDQDIVTQVEPLKNFYEAEKYHRDYFEKNPQSAYCQLVIAPKIEKFKHQFGT